MIKKKIKNVYRMFKYAYAKSHEDARIEADAQARKDAFERQKELLGLQLDNEIKKLKVADDYKREIHYITHIPDFTSVEFTQNASDPVLKAKTKPLLDLCLQKEKWFNKGYYKVLELTLNFVRDNDKSLYEKVKFDLSNVDLVYTHTLPSNDVDAVNMIVNLANKKLLAPRVGLQWLNSIPNVDDYIKEMDEYNKKLALEEEKQQNNNKGINRTNIERQNEKVQSAKQMDNKENFVNGKSQDIGN